MECGGQNVGFGCLPESSARLGRLPAVKPEAGWLTALGFPVPDGEDRMHLAAVLWGLNEKV